jgi:integrase
MRFKNRHGPRRADGDVTLMHRIYKIGILHECVRRNPVEHVETRSKSNYRAIIMSPAQTLAIMHGLPSPASLRLILTCAATALRSSEILALRWQDVLWQENRIRISKRWAKGEDGETKTDASDGYVPLHALLAGPLRAWQQQSPYAKETDFVFPSMKAKGKKPLYSSSFVADYLRPAAKKAGVHIADGQRFGLHNLRHSLSNWLVNKAKTDPKTVQGILRHAKIQTTLDLYTQEDSDETRAAQGEFLTAVGMNLTVQ